MAKVTKLEIAYTYTHKVNNVDVAERKVDKVYIRRPRFSTIMRLAGIVASDAKSINGAPVSAQEKMGEFFPKLIAETVADENGKTLFTADQVDLWCEEPDGFAKIMAYGKVINTALNPPEEAISGN